MTELATHYRVRRRGNRAACGASLFRRDWTDDVTIVTCKMCLKIAKKFQQQESDDGKEEG